MIALPVTLDLEELAASSGHVLTRLEAHGRPDPEGTSNLVDRHWRAWCSCGAERQGASERKAWKAWACHVLEETA